MAGNSIGELFRVTTFGESHGPALGCIVDGVPPGLALTEADMQADLDRRRPAHPAIPRSAVSRTRSEFCQGYLKEKPPEPVSGC